MKRKLFLLSLLILPFNTPVEGANLFNQMTSFLNFRKEKPCPPMIRVRIAHNIEGVNLEVPGPYNLYDPFTGKDFHPRFKGKKRYLETMNDGLKWGESFPGTYQLQIVPHQGDTFIVIDQREYPGLMTIYEIKGAGISLVNKLYIEDYIRLILAKNNYHSLHPETLASLAIIARTNALYQSMNPRNKYWDVDSEKVEYDGIPQLNEEGDYLNEEAVNRAVQMTRYMVMSRTGVYEGQATPFLAHIGPTQSIAKGVEMARLSLDEAEQMAREGYHAAQILSRAFPGTTIMLMDRQ
jgi:stage II sporulation protein D